MSDALRAKLLLDDNVLAIPWERIMKHVPKPVSHIWVNHTGAYSLNMALRLSQSIIANLIPRESTTMHNAVGKNARSCKRVRITAMITGAWLPVAPYATLQHLQVRCCPCAQWWMHHWKIKRISVDLREHSYSMQPAKRNQQNRKIARKVASVKHMNPRTLRLKWGATLRWQDRHSLPWAHDEWKLRNHIACSSQWVLWFAFRWCSKLQRENLQRMAILWTYFWPAFDVQGKLDFH